MRNENWDALLTAFVAQQSGVKPTLKELQIVSDLLLQSGPATRMIITFYDNEDLSNVVLHTSRPHVDGLIVWSAEESTERLRTISTEPEYMEAFASDFPQQESA